MVRMLFDFMLDVDRLSGTLQRLVIQLYIPILKAALLDSTFLSRDGHPVRRFLSETIKVAVEAGPDPVNKQDICYRKLKVATERVITEFDADLSIFSELAAELMAFIADERKRKALMGERIRGAKEGLARSENARQFVKNSVDKIFVNRSLPPIVVDFLTGAWSNVLFLAYLKEGEQSPAWLHAVQTAQQLVAMTQMGLTVDERYQLLKALPELLQAVEVGMLSVGCAPQEVAHFFAELEHIHLQHYQLVGERVHQRLANRPVVVPTVNTCNIESLLDAVSMVNEGIIETFVVTSDVVDPLLTVPVENVKVMKREDALRCVNALKVDTWLEFCESDDKKRRYKIAAILKPARQFIFVDRNGNKIAEKSAYEIVAAMEKGLIKLLG